MKRMLSSQVTIESKSGVTELLKLLKEEITAINNGDLDRVTALFDQKTNLLKRLDQASLEIEAQLKTETQVARELRKNLTELNGLIRKDSQLLANMVEATREIKSVIVKIRKRHSLDDLYSVDGEKRASPVVFTQQVDQSM